MFDDGDVRVLLVARDPLARAGLATIMEDAEGITIVGQVGSERDILAQVEVFQPEIVLWDFGWGPLSPEDDNFRQDLRELAQVKAVDIPALALLPGPDLAMDVWSAGATGLMLRDTSAEQIHFSLIAAERGLHVIDPEIGEVLLPVQDLEDAEGYEELTPREAEVLQLLAEGLPNKTIAVRLKISEHTVKFHVNAILGKLGAQSRTEAVVRASKLGWILL
jgi:DNA-binding NarL/FixJ family response regulator